MNIDNKWTCSVCTYENWSASFKCTMCRNSRDMTRIEDEMERLRLSSSTETADLELMESSYTFKCPYCNYVNLSQNIKCDQCFQVFTNADSNHRSSVFRQTSSVSLPRFTNSSFSNTTLTGSCLEKWTCSTCTYANWPKSKQCVMCCSSRINNSSISKNNQDEAKKDNSYLIKPSYECNYSETNIKSQLNSVSNVFLSSSPTSLDRCWLSFCLVVASGNVCDVEQYILNNTIYKIDRKLTKQECRYLNKQRIHLTVGSQNQRASTSDLNLDLPSSSSSSSLDDCISSQSADLYSTTAKHLDNSQQDQCSSNRQIRFRTGMSIVDIAIRFGQSAVINLFICHMGIQATRAAMLYRTRSKKLPNFDLDPKLKQMSKSMAQLKWMPCQASPHNASRLRQLLNNSVCYSDKCIFPCGYLGQWGTFALPYSIAQLPSFTKQLLLSELCDLQAQSELEDDAKAINWWFVPGQKQSSRLFALWNRTAGDCLLDSAMQACWGVFDLENCLRHTLAESLRSCESKFYPRWRNYEAAQAACHYTLDEDQCQRDWKNVLSTACQPREALEQIHIFALCHILRRPIIVYGVKYIKNYRNEPIGIANFQGIYLPLLWNQNFCSRNPIVLGYTRGHFSSLVPMEPHWIATLSDANSHTFTSPPSACSRPTVDDLQPDKGPNSDQNVPPTGLVVFSGQQQQNAFIYLPLVDKQGTLLPIHFTTEKEANISQTLLRDWLDVVYTRRGLPLARLRLCPKHPLVDKMLDDWLDSYCNVDQLDRQKNRTNSATSSSTSSPKSSQSPSPPVVTDLDQNGG